MIENGKLTLLDIEELCKKAHEFKVEFNITIHPDSVEVTLSPWQPTTMNTNTKVEPTVRLETRDEIEKRLRDELGVRTIMP